MVKRSWVTGVALLAACASAPSSGSDPQTPDRWIVAGAQEVALQLEESPTSTSIVIPEPRDDVLAAVVEAYEKVGIPVATIDPAAGLVANPAFRVSRRLADRRVSAFVSCGTASQGGRAADRYPVEMDISTRVEPLSADTSRVTTRLSAWARNPSGASSERIRCSSRGTLEQGILKHAYAALYDL